MEKTSDLNIESNDNTSGELKNSSVVAVLDPMFVGKSKLKFMAVFDAWCNTQGVGVRAVPVVRPTRWKRVKRLFVVR